MRPVSNLALTATPPSGAPIGTRSVSTQFVPRRGVRVRAAEAEMPTAATVSMATTTRRPVRRIRGRLGR